MLNDVIHMNDTDPVILEGFGQSVFVRDKGPNACFLDALDLPRNDIDANEVERDLLNLHQLQPGTAATTIVEQHVSAPGHEITYFSNFRFHQGLSKQTHDQPPFTEGLIAMILS